MSSVTGVHVALAADCFRIVHDVVRSGVEWECWCAGVTRQCFLSLRCRVARGCSDKQSVASADRFDGLSLVNKSEARSC